jgi:hypothetical protein
MGAKVGVLGWLALGVVVLVSAAIVQKGGSM